MIIPSSRWQMAELLSDVARQQLIDTKIEVIPDSLVLWLSGWLCVGVC